MQGLLRALAGCLLAVGVIGTAAVAAEPAGGPGASNGAKAPAPTGDAICTRCHDESETRPILAIYQTKHGVRGDARTPGCQSCHGASESHLKDKKNPTDVTFGENKSEVALQDAACLACHKAGKRTRWQGGQHQANAVGCAGCHEVHAPADPVLDKKTQTGVCFACHKEQRADTLKVSTHPIDAGKVVCSDCHNAHGGPGPKLLKRNTVTETCYACHAEKRGPYLWEHQPVTEDCTNCHTPHGSNISPLLKSRAPVLCDECHDGPHISNIPVGAGTVGSGSALPAGFGGRACLSCHNMIHGSNAPSGAFLHR